MYVCTIAGGIAKVEGMKLTKYLEELGKKGKLTTYIVHVEILPLKKIFTLSNAYITGHARASWPEP